jgi:nitric oxide reductase NorE protein
MVSDTFFMYYYTLTMVHMMHVSVGIGVLVFLVVTLRSAGPSERFANKLESGGLIWHMVDLLWIALFPLLYLVRV